MKRVLVVDDEPDIVELVSYNLRKEGFTVETSHDGEKALAMIRSIPYDLVILDLMLPGIQGLDLCRLLKSDPVRTKIPILMLTAKSEEVDKVVGLEMGADDYMTKPFSVRELVARTKAILRRSEHQETAPPEPVREGATILRIGDLEIDSERFVVTAGGGPVKLSATEFKLLLYLAERPNRIFSREHLLDAVWGNDVFVVPRTVDVHIRRLRTKVEEDPNNPKYIRTMRGIGYSIES